MRASATHHIVFSAICILILKELNGVVTEPYMDEPFHVPQAQAYCRGEWSAWNPKITTPPGLYILSVILKKAFLFKCNLSMLRLTPMLTLLILPVALTRLLCYHQRTRSPSSILTPTFEAVVLSAFPIVWFFGFLYYTEVPSVLFVVSTVVAASQGRHWLAALLGLISCTFRQTNVVWVLYAYASSQLMYLRFRRADPDAPPPAKLHDAPALTAGPDDLLRSFISAPKIVLDILPSFVPYALVVALFGAFVVWNEGIVLGDKSNHIPSFHVPQLYYFLGFFTAFAWPVLISGLGGPLSLLREVRLRIRTLVTALISAAMVMSIKLFTIHHPFLLSDNRHYTFYVWRRLFLVHPAVPYLLVPIYVACAWAWFLRVGQDQTLLQTLILPVCVLPTLLPTPLLEPRYFLIPYILLRSQVVDVPTWGVILEGAWYAAINAVTMWIFLYKERPGVGRFMW
ncbi:glycosyltransferase family 59 protein [Jaapia argillacea MUCL 33604]|uniref:Dol-P-Glc:Glc(2)Man(9)GlcNAc(2)-PP-Dol alpha-1,2-glucosyltransferase n=1 Tax=Jaapia argillacea MUCL 33604 TaxID=933084 RepID=A0A067PM09_9AGAM|nr:glycosyltransferase family 59 protein [Jaapia argillacea MUCL 33604]